MAVNVPALPVRSTDVNGIVGYDIYETTVALSPNATRMPVVTASASDPDVQVQIMQAESRDGTATVQFDYKGAVKTYRVIFVHSEV